jgi:hypothetical protein
MANKLELTETEEKAIRDLTSLSKKWPKTLWLYSAGGTLHVMRSKHGQHVFTSSGGIDPDYSMATIAIDNSGGDW